MSLALFKAHWEQSALQIGPDNLFHYEGRSSFRNSCRPRCTLSESQSVCMKTQGHRQHEPSTART